MALIAHYKFNNDLLDNSGNNYHAHVDVGGFNFVTGKLWQAVQPQSNTSTIIIPVRSISHTYSYSLAFWYFCPSNTDFPSGQITILSAGNNSPLFAVHNDANTAKIKLYSSSLSTGTINKNAWNCIVLCHTGGITTHELSINGAAKENLVTTVLEFTYTTLNVGSSYEGNTGSKFDNIAIYNHKITETDGTFYYNAGAGTEDINFGDLSANLPHLTISETGTCGLIKSLPKLTISADAIGVNLTLPHLTISETGTCGLIKSLPKLTISATCLNTSASADLQIPALTIESEAYVGTVATLDVELPSLTCEVGSGGSVDTDLPAITFEAEALIGLVGNLDEELPALEIDITALVGHAGTLNLNLPALTCEADNAPSVRGTLPALTIVSSAYVGQIGDLNKNLSSLRITSEAYSGSTGTVNKNLPSLEIESTSGASVDVDLPSMEITATGLTGQIGEVDTELSALELEAESKISQVGNLDHQLPKLTCTATALVGQVGTLDNSLRRFLITATGLTGQVGTLNLNLPVVTVSATGSENVIGTLNVSLSTLEIEAIGGAIPIEIYNTYAMNLYNFAVTKYNNFNFNSYCEYEGLFFGANPTGIAVLTGDNDEGTNIDALFLTGETDLDIDFKKRFNKAYINAKAEGEYELIFVMDDGEEITYLFDLDNTTLRRTKIGLGRGAQSNLWKIGLNNIDGSNFEVEKIELLATILSRR